MDLLKGLQMIFGGESSAPKNRNTPKDESLHHQESDLYKKNIKLREQLDDARERIVQLENQICSMKEENTKVEKDLDSKREEMDQMIAGVTSQIREMTASLEERMSRLEEKVGGQIEQLGADTKEQFQVSAQMDDQKASLAAVNETAENLKNEIADKIHAENVKCYRNIKSLVTDLEVKMEQMELGEESLTKIRRSFKGMKFFAFFAFLDFIGIVFYILYIMGVF